jgi:branched-chain amino acid transport system ATP-binding protein
MLEVRNLSVSYGVTEVLREVSFTVEEGKITALLGGNGSGKSTVLNTISGLIAPRAGSVRFAGQEVGGLSPEAVVRRGVVQVPQGREVVPDMSVADNLDLGAATRRDRAGIRADRETIYDRFPRLRALRSRRAGSLSGGEQTQLAIGRALMARPRLLLMDEPSVGLAPNLVDAMIDTVRALNRDGLTVLLVEQNVGVAADLAERAFVLKDGTIGFAGPAPALIENQEVLASYLGR